MERLRVLVVEDDSEARKMLVKFIAKEGFDVVEAEDAKVAFEKIDSEKPDIVITDLKMPHGDGIEIVRHAKKACLFCQAILITAFGELDTAITALREGVMDYMKKPLDLDALALALGRARDKVLECKNIDPYPSILLAEDDDAARTLLAKALRQETWEVTEAKDGEEAANLFQAKKFDLVVLDIKMPGKSGLVALHEMRESSKDFEAIVITGYGDEQSVLEALRGGAINFVKKPIDVEQLIIFIEKALAELMIKRALKYRNRELELAKNVIARIAGAAGLVVIDFLAPRKVAPSNLALTILDLLPMGLIVVDVSKEIYYVNKPIALAVEGKAKQMDEAFVKGLEKVGIHTSFKELASAVDKVFSMEEGVVETLKIGQWAYITMVKLMLIQGDKRDEVVLLATRGERK